MSDASEKTVMVFWYRFLMTISGIKYIKWRCKKLTLNEIKLQMTSSVRPSKPCSMPQCCYLVYLVAWSRAIVMVIGIVKDIARHKMIGLLTLRQISPKLWAMKMADIWKTGCCWLFCLPRHSYRELRYSYCTMWTSSRLHTYCCLNALIFGIILSACVKEYLIAATY